MNKSLYFRTEKYIINRQRRRRWLAVVSVLGCVVTFITTYALILPVLSMSKTEKELTCPLCVHVHDDSCYDNYLLTCTEADYVVHSHDDGCYDDEGNLVCELKEVIAHTHTEECYETSSSLSCELAENEEHIHTEECYTETKNLVCQNDEIVIHTHNDDCYDEEENLICEKQQVLSHAHGESCFTVIEKDTEAAQTETDSPLPSDNVTSMIKTAQAPMSLAQAPATASASTVLYQGTCGDNLNWALTDDGTLTVSGTGDMKNYSSSNAPWYSYRTRIKAVVVEDGVTSIGNYAFYNSYTNLVSLELSSTVTNIGNYAFYNCSALPEVYIPSGVTYIGNYAFYSCDKLASVSGFGGVSSMGNNVFSNCNILANVDLYDGLTIIGKNMFYSCRKITSISIPDSVESIEEKAFYYCDLQPDVDLPLNLKTIDGSAFAGCSKLTQINVSEQSTNFKTVDGVLFDYDITTLILYPSGKTNSEYIIPETVDTIGKYAFLNASKISKITFNENLKTIKSNAFESCYALKKVNITANVEVIEDDAFYGCSNLTSLTVDENNMYYCDDNGVLYNYDKSELIMYPSYKEGENYTIQNTVTLIKPYAFRYSKNLKNIEFEEGSLLTSIGKYAFSYSDSIETVKLPPNLSIIEDHAFYYCDLIREIDIPLGVTSIGSYAFYNCTALENIYLPSSLKTIKNQAFYSCTSLEAIEIPSGVTSIEAYAFRNCSSLKTIIIPDSVTSLANYVFYDCKMLKEVVLSKSLTSLGMSTFYNCVSLKKITIGSELKTINSSSFSGCNSIENITFTKDVSLINYSIIKPITNYTDSAVTINFEGENYFTYSGNNFECSKFILSEGKYYVDEYGILYRLSSNYGVNTASVVSAPLELRTGNLVLPEVVIYEDNTQYTLTTIEPYAFSGCVGLGGIEFPDTIQTISQYAFEKCIKITSVSIPETVTNIGNNAFVSCEMLESVNGYTTFPEVLTNMTGLGINTTTFFNTALWNNNNDSIKIITESIVIDKENGRLIKLSTGTTEALTGEKVTSTLEINKGTGDNSNVVRVYFQFESKYGTLSTTIGEHFFDGIPVDVCIVNDTDNLYYIEVASFDEINDTVSADIDMFEINLNSMYQNAVSGGGRMLVWLCDLTIEEAVATKGSIIEPRVIGDDGYPLVHQVIWKTDPKPLDVTTEAYLTDQWSIYGDGTENGSVSVRNLAFSTNFNYNLSVRDAGMDYVSEMGVTVTAVLPEDFSWKNGLIDAVNDGNWRVFSKTSAAYGIYVLFEGKEHDLGLSISKEYDDVVLSLDDDGNLQYGYTYNFEKNESKSYSDVHRINSGLIIADVEEIEKSIVNSNGNVSYDFVYEYQFEHRYLYSKKIITTNASARGTISVEPFNISLEFTEPDAYMGETITSTITIKNLGALHNNLQRHNSGMLLGGSVKNIKVKLNKFRCMSYEDIEKALYDKTYGDKLSIEIKNSVIISPSVQRVLGTDKRVYTLTHEYIGDNVVRSTAAAINLCWSDDGSHIILTASYYDSVERIDKYIEYGIGTTNSKYDATFSTVREAFESLGYIVSYGTLYTYEWDVTDMPIYSGETVYIEVDTTCKDSFKEIGSDHRMYANSVSTLASSSAAVSTSYVCFEDSSRDISAKHQAASNYYNPYILRDFVYTKHAYKDGQPIDDSSEIVAGNIIMQSSVIDHNGNKEYDALPLTEYITNAQVLLVPSAQNEELSDISAGEIDVNGNKHYILNQPGEYKSVMIGKFLADRIVINNTKNGIETYIYFYLTEVKGDVTVNINYPTLISTYYAGMSSTNENYSVYTKGYLNALPSHRLYDDTSFLVRSVSIDNNIVLNMETTDSGSMTEHDFTSDDLTKMSIVNEGDTVTYRLSVYTFGNDSVKVYGSNMRYELSANNGCWSKDDIRINYIHGEDSEYTITNGDSWNISYSNNIMTLQWGSDFEATVKGTLYIYITLNYPDGESWDEYTKLFASEYVTGSFKHSSISSSVTHSLGITAQIRFDSGIYLSGIETGIVSNEAMTSENRNNALQYYTNDTQDDGIVSYYICLYNSGITRYYLSDIQAVLPDGFTYYENYYDPYDASPKGYYENSHSNKLYYESLVIVDDTDGTDITYKKAAMPDPNMTVDMATGRDIVIFSLDNHSGYANLAYDDMMDKYYLKPGEALVVAFNCKTNNYADSTDYATAKILMPYYNYNGAGFETDDDVIIERKPIDESDIRDPNYGETKIITNSQAGSLGVEDKTTDMNTKWLSSDVAVRRGDIIPGVSVSSESTVAGYDETITWHMRIDNSGEDVMRDFTITDVMLYPYQFIGSFDVEIGYNYAPDFYITKQTLFSFENRSADGNSVVVTSNSGNQKTLSYGTPVLLNCTVNNSYTDYYSTKESIEIELCLSKDNNGNEVLSVYFPEDSAQDVSIPANGFGIYTFRTKDLGNTHFNTTYYNTCYLTPDTEKGFDQVTSGKQTDYNDLPSIVADTAVDVTYGYSTTSIKSVVENGNESNRSDTTDGKKSIVLSELSSTFRYSLSVEDSGGGLNSQAMKKFVLIDSLPSVGDHSPFYDNIERYSEFKVDFAEDLNLSVKIEGLELNAEKYTVQFSDVTEFTADDWDLVGGDRWLELDQIDDIGEMRSIRVVIDDPSGTLLPVSSEILISFDAEIDLSNGAPEPSSSAFNNFGYLCSLVGSISEYKVTSQKIEIITPSIPTLSTELIDADMNKYPIESDETFTFFVYEGEDSLIEALNGEYTDKDILDILSTNNVKFTVVQVPMLRGDTVSDRIVLKDLKCYIYTDINGDGTNDLTETESLWDWADGSCYTFIEDPFDVDGIYKYKSMNDHSGKAYSFVYDSEISQNIVCTNVRRLYTIQLFKLDVDSGNMLEGAVFGLYSRNSEDLISASSYDEWIERFAEAPQKTLMVDGTVWYLKDIDASDANGTIQWKNLKDTKYYAEELLPPEGYNFNLDSGVIIEFGEDDVKPVEVTNQAGKVLPMTGGEGIEIYVVVGISFMLTATSLIYLQRKKRSQRYN